MSLLSGKKIRAMKWTQNPILDEIITRVENLVESESIPLLDKQELIFKWDPGQRFGTLLNTNKNTSYDNGNNNEDNVIDYIIEDDDSDDDESSHHSGINSIVDNDNNIDEISQNKM